MTALEKELQEQKDKEEVKKKRQTNPEIVESNTRIIQKEGNTYRIVPNKSDLMNDLGFDSDLNSQGGRDLVRNESPTSASLGSD